MPEDFFLFFVDIGPPRSYFVFLESSHVIPDRLMWVVNKFGKCGVPALTVVERFMLPPKYLTLQPQYIQLWSNRVVEKPHGTSYQPMLGGFPAVVTRQPWEVEPRKKLFQRTLVPDNFERHQEGLRRVYMFMKHRSYGVLDIWRCMRQLSW